jgi:hypothetical protein
MLKVVHSGDGRGHQTALLPAKVHITPLLPLPAQVGDGREQHAARAAGRIVDALAVLWPQYPDHQLDERRDSPVKRRTVCLHHVSPRGMRLRIDDVTQVLIEQQRGNECVVAGIKGAAPGHGGAQKVGLDLLLGDALGHVAPRSGFLSNNLAVFPEIDERAVHTGRPPGPLG